MWVKYQKPSPSSKNYETEKHPSPTEKVESLPLGFETGQSLAAESITCGTICKRKVTQTSFHFSPVWVTCKPEWRKAFKEHLIIHLCWLHSPGCRAHKGQSLSSTLQKSMANTFISALTPGTIKHNPIFQQETGHTVNTFKDLIQIYSNCRCLIILPSQTCFWLLCQTVLSWTAALLYKTITEIIYLYAYTYAQICMHGRADTYICIYLYTCICNHTYILYICILVNDIQLLFIIKAHIISLL